MPLTGAAAVRLYDDHVDAVHALITRRVGPAASPQVTAEAFEHAMRTWDRFDRDRGTERLFLFGAAVAVIRRHDTTETNHLTSLRTANFSGASAVADPLVPGSNNTAPRVVDHRANHDLLNGDLPISITTSPRTGTTGSASNTDDLTTVENATVEGDPVTRIMSAVAELAPDDRDILLMSLWESCPQSDVAEALDLSVASVRSALGRIRRELKVATSPSKSERKRRR